MNKPSAVIADTDMRTIETVASLLSPQRFDVSTAATPREVEGTVAGHRSALVVASESLDGFDAARVCRRLKRMVERSHIVLVLDRYDRDRVSAAYEAGADDVVAKPLVDAELRARLGTAARMLELEEVRTRLEDESALLAEITARAHFYSRRYLESQLDGEITRARRFEHSLSLILAEIAAAPGDERAMRAVGHYLSERFRANVDWVARYDDCRFAFVLPETGLSGALSATERVQAELNDDAVRTSAGLPSKLQVRFGVSATEPARLRSPHPPNTQIFLAAAEAYLADAVGTRDRRIAAGPVPHA